MLYKMTLTKEAVDKVINNMTDNQFEVVHRIMEGLSITNYNDALDVIDRSNRDTELEMIILKIIRQEWRNECT